jgi:hypothetical protein
MGMIGSIVGTGEGEGLIIAVSVAGTIMDGRVEMGCNSGEGAVAGMTITSGIGGKVGETVIVSGDGARAMGGSMMVGSETGS